MLAPLRFALRRLVRTPGFTMVAVAVLGIGIGGNTAVFSVVNAVLLHPTGIAEPERVVTVRTHYHQLNLASLPISAPVFAWVRDNRQVFARAAIMNEVGFHYVPSPGALPERLQGAQVSVEWFDVFGATPTIGRVFRPTEEQPNSNRVVVLSYATWQRLFGGDPNVLGRNVRLDGEPYEIVGVIPQRFRWPLHVDVWVPIQLPAEAFSLDNGFDERFLAVAQLKPGYTATQADAFVKVFADRLRNGGGPGSGYIRSSGWGLHILPLAQFAAGETRRPLLILLGAMGFVLLITCTNVAGLLLARASRQADELNVRVALGAQRSDLIRLAFAEVAILVVAGSVLGLAVAYVGTRTLLLLAPDQWGSDLRVEMDGYVLLFTIGVALGTSILCGLAPVWDISRRFRRSLAAVDGGRGGTAGRERQRARAILVVGEVALALTLLFGAGLFVRSLTHLIDEEPGFEPQGVMTATLSLPASSYGTEDRRALFYRALDERLAALPGVTAAGLGGPLPLSGIAGSASFAIDGRPRAPRDPGPHADMRHVSPGYFSALRIPVITGRTFSIQDGHGSEPVVVIDENLAKQYWRDESPIGRRVRRGSRPWATIVGVVGHVKHSDLAGDTGKGAIYYPLFQEPTAVADIAVRTERDPVALAQAIRKAVQEVDSGVAAHRLESMPALVAASLSPRRFAAVVLSSFAGAALLLAVLGLYAFISYGVAQRTREIGIRMALGAPAPRVLGMILWQGLRLVAVGTVIGVGMGLALARLVSSQLFGVSPFDIVILATAIVSIFLVAAIASYLPAHRAAKIDPSLALRNG